jgi:hypothetical protein
VCSLRLAEAFCDSEYRERYRDYGTVRVVSFTCSYAADHHNRKLDVMKVISSFKVSKLFQNGGSAFAELSSDGPGSLKGLTKKGRYA